MKLFISYSHKNVDAVEKLVALLKRNQHQVWWDNDLKIGSLWRTQIKDEIAAADGLVYVLSPDSVVSKWCTYEFTHAVRSGKLIIPVKIVEMPDADIPPAISDYQYTDLIEFSEDETAKLLVDLNQLAVTVPPNTVKPVVVPRFAKPERAYVIAERGGTALATHWGNIFNVNHGGIIRNGIGAFGIIGILLVFVLFAYITRDNDPSENVSGASNLRVTDRGMTQTEEAIGQIPTPFSSDEFGVVVMDFQNAEESGVPDVAFNIEGALEYEGIEVLRVKDVPDGENPEEQRVSAREVGRTHNATLVIWGQATAGGVRYYIETVTSRGEVETSVDKQQIFLPPEDLSILLLRSDNILYVVRFVEGQLSYFKDDYATAEANFLEAEQYLAAGSEDELQVHALYFYLGYIAWENMDYVKSVQRYTYAIEFAPTNEVLYSNRGLAHVENRDYQLAIEDYLQAITINRSYPEAYNNLGLLYVRLGDADQAFAYFDQSIAVDEYFALGYYNRGLSYDERGDYQLALKDYDRSIELDPTYGDAYINRGILYANLNNRDQALDDLTHAIKLDPDNAVPYNNRGFVYFQLGEYDAAFEDYNKAISLNKNFAEPYNNRGILYLQQRQFNLALSDFNRAIGLDRSYGNPYYNRGLTLTLALRPNFAAAEADARMAVFLLPEFPAGYELLGYVMYQQGKHEAAWGVYQYLLTLSDRPFELQWTSTIIANIEAEFDPQPTPDLPPVTDALFADGSTIVMRRSRILREAPNGNGTSNTCRASQTATVIQTALAANGTRWVQLDCDGGVGWLPEDDLNG